MDLQNKNIALISPKFYGYEDYIADNLRKRGATVHLIYENVEWVKFSYRFVYVYMPGAENSVYSAPVSQHQSKALHMA